MNMQTTKSDLSVNDEALARWVVDALDQNLTKIDEGRLAKLRASRTAALDAYRAPVRVLGLVTIGGHILDVNGWIRKPAFLAPLVAVAILAAVGTYNIMSNDDLADEAGAIDAKLLASETPIDALLDNDFAAWVQESTQQ